MRSLIFILVLLALAGVLTARAPEAQTVSLPDTLIWEAVPLPPFERGGDAIAFRGDTLYACIGRVFRRPPGGDWEFAWRDLSCSKGWRWDPGVIYQARRGLERSTDGGQTWATVVEDRSMPPIDTPGGALLTSAEGGSARSTDNGITWTPALWPDGGGLPQSLLVVDPTPELPGGRIVGAGFNGVAYSDDDGRTWKPTEIYAFLGLYSEGGVRITGGPEDGVLLVSLDGTQNGLSGGVWRSENGADWDLIGRTFDDVVGVTLTAGPDGQVYAWDGAGDRVLGSADGGRTWRLLSLNIEPSFGLRLRDMIVGPDGRLYAIGVASGGIDVPIYRTVDPVAVASAELPEASGATLRVEPNPASGATTVRLTLPSPEAEVRVSFFDARGREITTLASGARGAGAHALEVDTSGWAAGVYVVRAEVGGEVLSTRVTVMR